MPDEVHADIEDLHAAAEGFRDSAEMREAYTHEPPEGLLRVTEHHHYADERYGLENAVASLSEAIATMDQMRTVFSRVDTALTTTAWAYQLADLEAAEQLGYRPPPEDGPR